MARNYTVEEVAEICRVRPYTVQEWLRDGKLKGIKPGRRWLITPEDLTEYLEKKHG